ncbi:helix-turn-helix domain-containing protein [Filimonas effusa]|nr:helix-turn-helix domain-containing protein [Filimonas effusa]
MKVFATSNPADDKGTEVPVPAAYRQYIVPVNHGNHSCRRYDFGYIISQEIPVGKHTFHRFYTISDRSITLYPFHDESSIGIMYNLKGSYSCQITPYTELLQTRTGDYGPYYAPVGANEVQVGPGFSGALQILLQTDELLEGLAEVIPDMKILLNLALQHSPKGRPVALLRMNTVVRDQVNRVGLYDPKIQHHSIYFHSILYILATELTKHLHEYNRQKSDGETSREKVERVHDFILESPSLRTCTMDYLSQLAGLSEASLRKTFKQLYNQPIQNFVRTQCLQKAADLLRQDTDMRIEDIAYEVGYANQANLSNAFKAMYGMYPRDYRRSM